MKELDEKMNAALAGDTKAIADLKKMLELDELNWAYFFTLLKSKKAANAREPLVIFEDGLNGAGKSVAFPTAIAPPEMMAQLPSRDYAGLKTKADYATAAKGAVLWVKKMQAGSGSSMTRTSYLAKLLGVPESEVKIGAKGTDLFVEVPDPVHHGKTARISLAEAQILQSVLDAERGELGGIIFHDILGSETEASVNAIWKKPSLLDPTKTYEELLKARGLSHSGRSFQSFIPTLDEAGKLSVNRTAPGGHGLFGVDALRAAYIEGALPDTKGKPLISVVGNGEDLSSTPDNHMVGWMVKENIPIAMVTTEKTPNDLKGGQIALVKKADGSTYMTIIEAAQAKEANQQKLFERLGLDVRRGDQISFFNTNMALFNYDALRPKIKKLVAEIGEEEFLRIIAPDLIENRKEQKDFDGTVRKYLQLEGAMGSSILNLDRYWRQKYNEPLVHVLNVDKQHRTDFFSPIKSAFDYFMQFHSDRFSFNPRTMRLENQRPGALPDVTLGDKHYADVQNVMDTFKGASLKGLDKLKVDGVVNLSNATLVGNVTIENKSGKTVDLSGRRFENVTVTIDEQGKIEVK